MNENRIREAVAWLGSQEGAMLRLLEDVVNVDSGSYDKAGVDAVGERFRAFFAEQGIPTASHPNAAFGDAITADVAGPGGANKPILLLGHRDTVFPAGEAGRRPFRVENGRAYGPGVADMKAGLVMNAFVLAAFHRFGGAPAPLVALITSDEEIGSPACRAIIESTARGARAVFNSEPGRPSGNVVTGRKGGVFMECEVTGKAAHSGGAFQDGISAITEMAHKIVRLAAVTDLEAGVTLNVGLVSGGQSVNTVAPWAKAGIDLRYVEPPQRASAMTRIEEIVASSTVPGTSATLTIKGEFLPLVQDEASRQLFDGYRSAMAELGATVEGEF
ncbi:MAG: M20 family metallopeptidase, partial [Methylobacteriaceae bacterium]|nr:M20 family metallopeptidase [Methylobacteriaceae bacterium]